MTVHTYVLPQLNLAVFAYVGHITFAEAQAAVSEVARHPDHHDTMRQLCDLAGVESVERNFLALMQTQARMAEHLIPPQGERIVVFHAPHAMAQQVAHMARKSWDGQDQVLVRVVDREEQSLALLGLKAASIRDLFVLGA